MPRRRSMAVLAATALLTGLSAGTAQAEAGPTTWYVDDTSTTCSDTGPGSQAQPFCQIQPAADRAVAGDTVSIVATATAYAPVTISTSGRADAPITFAGASTTGFAQLSAQDGPALTLSGAKWVHLSRLAISSSGSTALHLAGAQPMTFQLGCGSNVSAPLTITCGFDTTPYDLNSVAFPVTGAQVDFGDGTVAHLNGSRGSVTHTYSSVGAHTVTGKAADAAGHTTGTTATAVTGTSYVSVGGPTRVLDTRNGTGAAKHRIGAGQTLRLKITGATGVPTHGVAAVTLNLTDVNASSASFVTAYPDGRARPTASSLNFAAGQINPNLVTVPVSSDGYIDLYNAHGTVDLVADLQGYFTTTASDTDYRLSRLVPLGPTRVLDTRNGTGATKAPLGSGKALTVHLSNTGRAAVTNAVLNLTVTGATGSGSLTVYCGSAWPPAASNLNYRAGQTTSNLVVTNVCSGGTFQIYNHGAPVQVIADLQGLYTNQAAGTGADTAIPEGSTYVPTSPARFLDTRNGTGAPAHPLATGSTTTVKIAGTHGVPRNATAVLVNLTGTAPTTATYLTAWGSGATPTASNLNLARGETRPILAVVPIDAGGCIHLYNHAGTVHVIADLEGYLS